MLYNLHLSSKIDPRLADSLTDLLQSSLRTIVITISLVYFIWAHTVSFFLFPEPIGWQVWYILPVLALAGALAFWLIPKNLLTAQIVWQLGLSATITLAIYIFQRPEIAFFYALLPLIAMLSLNWIIGSLVEGAIAMLVWWLSYRVGLLPLTYAPTVIIAGAITLTLGWVMARVLLTVTQWALHSLIEAQKNLEDVRQHRAELMQLQKSLDQANYQLERANTALVAAWHAADEAQRFKTNFVHNVSHELRTPLNLIVGFSEMMTTSPESYDNVVLPSVYRGDMNSVYHNAQHLLALMDDILDLGRIEAGKISLIHDVFELPVVVTEAVDMVHDYIATKRIELRTKIVTDLPQVWGDRLRVRQVLLNLLVNAARFTERNGWIEVTVAPQDETMITVRVTDTGPGISEQDLSKIFQEFRSTDQPLSTWHSGTGLGLPISKKFVELNGGQMGVESQVGQGTTFWFTIPVLATAEITSSATSPAKQTLPPVQLRSTERIVVVVHDDPNVARVLQRYLDGYHVVGAETLTAGLNLAKEVKAIAMLAEDMESIEPSLSGQVQAECLFITCPLPSGRWAALMMGAEAFLTKPVSRQRLLTAIHKLDTPIEQVLIADDKPEVVELFGRMLKSQPDIQSCLHAYNGQETLTLAKSEQPDLILLDLIMPDIHGRTVLERLTADPELAEIPVIIISAEAQSQINPRAAEPMKIYRSHPYQMNEMMRTLEGIFKALAPGWHQLDATASGFAAAPPASPVLANKQPPLNSGPVGVHSIPSR